MNKWIDKCIEKHPTISAIVMISIGVGMFGFVMGTFLLLVVKTMERISQ